MGEPRVLLVEDDDTLRGVIAMHLEHEGMQVHSVDDGNAALSAFRETAPDILVLDVMLPELSGLEVAARVREETQPSPGIVMITALGGEDDVVNGFRAGADDYVVKPLRPRELLERLRSLHRRLNPSKEAVRAFGRMRLLPDARRLEVDGQPVHLTPTEFALLLELTAEPHRVCSRSELLSKVFDTEHAGYARNVDCHVTRLRRKLESHDLPSSLVQTVHGHGYSFVPTE